MRKWAAAAALAVAGMVATPPASGAGRVATPPASGTGLPASARLQGVFAMSGRVTDAVNTDEHRGEIVERTWTFTSPCPVGACPTLTLVRTRNRTVPPVTDQLVLHRRSPGFYSGTSTFFAPVRCAGRRYAEGEAVPFAITVRVTAAQLVGDQVLATTVRAFYRSTRRIGLTQCVSAPAHDAAGYTGTALVPPGSAMRSEPSTRSRTAS